MTFYCATHGVSAPKPCCDTAVVVSTGDSVKSGEYTVNDALWDYFAIRTPDEVRELWNTLNQFRNAVATGGRVSVDAQGAMIVTRRHDSELQERPVTRAQRIALAVWRRRKPLRYCCYGWTRWSDGRVEFQKKPSRPHGTWGVLCS